MTAQREIRRWIRTATTVIVAVLLGVTGLLAQEDLDAHRRRPEQGDAEAQLYLGRMYSRGERVPRDDTEAMRWYRMAASQGDADAQYAVGISYVLGHGVLQDDAEAVRWLSLAAEQGNPDGQNVLGVMYSSGRGVIEDDTEAVRWHRLAASQGNADDVEPHVREHRILKNALAVRVHEPEFELRLA